MTEINEQTPSITTSEPENQSPAMPEKKPVTWETAVLLVLAFLAALWYGFGHNLFSGHYYGPGIGLTISHWVLTAAILILARIRSTLKLTPQGIFLLVLSLLLSAVYGIFTNTYMKLMNLPVLLLLSAQALFTLTGHISYNPLSGQGLWEGFRRYFPSLFRCWSLPLHALLWRCRQGRERKFKGEQIFFGIFTAFGTAILALVLLSSADEMFAGMIENSITELEKIDDEFIARLILSFLLAMLLFSHRISLLQSPANLRPFTPGEKNPLAFRLILAALAIVYALFAYVQVRYLFMGTENVQMSSGYAAYARSGFFQLVLIALLTLCLILPALILCRKDKSVKILCAIVAFLTIVIDVSAFCRMRLYIDAYGLTTLRIVTLWGIGMILLSLLGAIIKVLQPSIRICPILAVITLTTWIGLNYTNVDRMAINSQVSRYNKAIRATVDTTPDSLDSKICLEDIFFDQYWSPDYYPALDKIEDPANHLTAQLVLNLLAKKKKDEKSGNTLALYDWSLSYLHVSNKK